MHLDERAAKTVAEEGLEDECSGLILAVSGGADSLAMLSWYATRKLPFPLTVAHVHHGLRDASDREEILVREQCEKFGIPITVFHVKVKDQMKKGETIESAARRLRYEFFHTLATERKATHLATAHTLDDQAETVLLHLLHGAGPRGLCGIFPKRTDGELTLIRPLIRCSRQEVEDYCRQKNLPYATDESNQDLTYTRNRIRHELIPRLKEFNPQILSALGRTADALQKQQSAVEQRAERFLSQYPKSLPAKELQNLPEGERREILRLWLKRKGKDLSAEQTAQAVDLLRKPEGSVEFDRKWVLHLGQGHLTVFDKNTDPFPQIRITEEETRLPDGRMLRLVKKTVTEKNRLQCIPCTLPITLRTRKNGDKIGTTGGTKSLAKRMMEKKIPLEQRDRALILTDGTGILWCEGLGANLHNGPSPKEEGYFVFLSEQ